MVRAGAQRLHGPRFLPLILHGGLALTAWGPQAPLSTKQGQPKAVTRDASGMEARRGRNRFAGSIYDSPSRKGAKHSQKKLTRRRAGACNRAQENT